MIGLDTNLLVRYFTQDHPVQSAIATEVLEDRLTRQEPGFVSIVAMAETVWVLDRAYGLSMDAIANVIGRLLAAETLVIESEREVHTAMTALREGRARFADALIGALNI